MIKNKKILSVLLLCLSFFVSSPQKTHAQYIDIAAQAKDYFLDTVAWNAANIALNRITAQTVNWINSGFQGGPAFVTNPGQFFLDLADEQASIFLSKNGTLNQLCTPFRAEVRLALIRNYMDEGRGQYSCTLGRILDNYEQFTSDFNQGGWDSWLEITQNNSNNPFGAYIEAETQLQKNIDSQVRKYTAQLSQGRGLLSFERCPDGEDYIDDNGKQQCWGIKETVTPGSAVQGQLDKVLGSAQDRINVSDEINEIVGALLNQLTAEMFSSAGGLLGLSGGGGGGGGGFMDDLAAEVRDDPDKPANDGSEGGEMTCNEDQTQCEIRITQPGEIVFQTPEEIIAEEIASLEARLRREEEELRRLLIIGCPNEGIFGNPCGDKINDKRKDVQETRDELDRLRRR